MADDHLRRYVRGKAAIANTKLAYQEFLAFRAGPRWLNLSASGARLQRPLWASTSTKDPLYPDTYYVEALIAPDSVNTMPPSTVAAYRDHGNPAIRIGDGLEEARAVPQQLGKSESRWTTSPASSSRPPWMPLPRHRGLSTVLPIHAGGRDGTVVRKTLGPCFPVQSLAKSILDGYNAADLERT